MTRRRKDPDPTDKPPGMVRFTRNLFEFAALFAIWGVLLAVIGSGRVEANWLAALVVAGAWAKTAFFASENLQELWQATRYNLSYHHFMLLMLINMSQIITSFALDYHCLEKIKTESLGAIAPTLSEGELLFECFYFSVLNFTFFGYGDITPQTIPAKLVTLTEILLAFVTVIFLLSDFIALKESLRQPESRSKD
ncbi:MAG: potassium channel family protein [Pirellulaceae bacterium]|nr:potassium channel family protein [Pirellulaceae bacterium]